MFQPSISNVRTVLCLGAHSDDIEIGCGGTLLELLHHNPDVNVHWIVLSGQEQRAVEAQLSAERFLSSGRGHHTIQLKSFRDSYFPMEWEDLKTYFHSLAAEIQPDLIFTHRRDDAHQDHRTVAELTWCAFRNHTVFEYEISKYEGDLGQPNVFLPVSSHHTQTKIDLLMECFTSQRGKPWFDEETFRAMMRLRGVECHSESRYAEAFHSRKMSLSVGATDRKSATGASSETGAGHVRGV